MDIQELVTTAGPWVAALVGVLTAVTTLRGAFGSQRLREDMRATAELAQVLSDTGADRAADSLKELLAIQADRFYTRGRDGVQFTARQAFIIVSGTGLVLLTGLASATAILQSTDVGSDGEGADWLLEVAFQIALVGVLLSAMVLAFSLLGAAEAWIITRTKRQEGAAGGLTEGDRVVNGLLFPVVVVLERLRRRRQRKAEARGTTAPQPGESDSHETS